MSLADLPLEHYTDAPFILQRSRVYEQQPPMGMMKPVGLWVSVPGGDPDWPEWCREQEFALNRLAHRSRVRLSASANVLFITSPSGLDSVHQQYSVRDDRMEDYLREFDRGEWDRKFWPMDWRRFAADYQGIIVTPYLWSRRLDGPSWYYGFDCASGCIWGLDAIESVESLGSPTRGRDLIWNDCSEVNTPTKGLTE